MKKSLLLGAAIAMTAISAFSADPVIPDSYDLTSDSRGVTITQGVNEDWDDYYTIEVYGTSAKENVTLDFNLPEGWDGIIYVDRVLAAWDIRPARVAPQWIDLDKVKSELAGEEVQISRSIEIPVDGQTHVISCWLYSGDRADMANGFLVLARIEKGEEKAPEFPEEFDVKASVSSVSISQEIDDETDVPILNVTGSTFAEDVTLTFDLPDGWDGIIGGFFSFGIMKKAPAGWATINEFHQEMGGMIEDITEGLTITIPVDGEIHMGQYYLYSDGYVDIQHGFMVLATIEKSMPDGVTEIGSGTTARYFNLQGAEVAAPGNGVFIRIADGKASKVIMK